MSCPSSYQFPVSTNATLGTQLNQTLWQSFALGINNSTLYGASFLSTLYCAADFAQQCYGICPNADLAGVGVRAAFWISSILQALLVAISPEDSTQGAWTAAILTASVTIPAFIQKRQRALSIYHATLVLNFATFSSIVSLAVAPMCTVWREGPTEEDDLRTYHIGNPAFEVALYGEEGQPVQAGPEPLTNLPKRKVHRERLVLSLALLTQVALQWAWIVMLFTDPEYYQKACIPETIVLLFGKPFSTGRINHGLFFIWSLWLLFNLAITLIWGILLVHSSSPSVHPVLSRSTSRLDLPQTWRDKLPVDKGRIMVLMANVMAFLISVLFLVSSEVQVVENCVIGGEDTDWSFGQIAALLVALAPAWPISAAIERRQKPKEDSPERRMHHDTESNSGIYQGSISVTPSEGMQTPLLETCDVSQVDRISITEDSIGYSYSLAVPQDEFRQRASHKGTSTS